MAAPTPLGVEDPHTEYPFPEDDATVLDAAIATYLSEMHGGTVEHLLHVELGQPRRAPPGGRRDY